MEGACESGEAAALEIISTARTVSPLALAR